MDNDQAVQLIEHHVQEKTLEIRQALKEYDIVDIHYDPSGGSHVVLAERTPETNQVEGAFPEMGFIDPSPFTSWTRAEHVSELRDRRGLRNFYDMVRSDGAVRSAMRMIKTPVQGADWYVQPASDSAIDKNIAKFVSKNLFEELDMVWEHVIEDTLRMLDFGYMPFEKVWREDGNQIKLAKLHPIHPLDIQGWEYHPDGSLAGIQLEPLTGFNRDTQPTFIPFRKLLLFVFEREAGDLRGTSILRSAFKHFYYKDILYKIDAIQKERHAIGVPCIKLPVGFSSGDKAIANELGRNLRTNDRAYVVAPANWEISFAKLEGQPVDPIPSIDHHDHKIYEGIMATFMGQNEARRENLDTFYKSTRYIAKSGIAAPLNRWVVKELVDMNFRRKGAGYPVLKVRRMGEWEETRTITFALRNLVGAQMLTPDERLEVYIRDLLSLPEMDKSTSRQVTKPGQQQPGPQGSPTPPGTNTGLPHVGLPRQKSQPPVATPESNAGTDRRGSAAGS